MLDRVVALQLLSSYWLAVILPPLPGILCFSAIYNEHVSTLSGFSSHLHQGRKFGGYKILPKPCKDTSTPEKEAGICMFNFECSQRAGTVVGSCMDGFLYGTCCKLPSGVSISTVNALPETTSPKPAVLTLVASDRSTTVLKPHIEHSPEETFLLYKNGTVVQNVNSPDDFLIYSKQQTPLIPHTSPLPESSSSLSDLQNKIASGDGDGSSSTGGGGTSGGSFYSKTPAVSASQIFDTVPSGFVVTMPEYYSSTTSRPYVTTTSSREPFSPNFPSPSKYSVYSTKISSPFTSSSSGGSSSSIADDFATKYGTVSTAAAFVTNKNDIYDDEENLIRVPTLTVDGPLSSSSLSSHKYGGSNSSNSIGHILWLLNNDTTKSEPFGGASFEEMSTQPTQSFYTWLSVQNAADKIGFSTHHSTRPIASTALPSTTVHHIPGPSFHVTPEVKITPKPQQSGGGGTVSEPAPTVIVLPPQQHESAKKPATSTYSTTATYNNSYHFSAALGSGSTGRPTSSFHGGVKPSPDRPSYAGSSSVTITTKPSRPQSTFVTKRPPFDDYPAKPSNQVWNTAFPVTTSPFQIKPIKTTSATTTTTLRLTNKPPTKPTTTSPSIIQTTLVTTAKPIWSGSGLNSDTIAKPIYTPAPIPIFSNGLQPMVSTSSYVTIRPPTTVLHHGSPDLHNSPPFPFIPGTNILAVNTTDSTFDFPPVRDPNVNLTATQQEKPIITSTTTFGDDDTEIGEVTPQFVVDKTLEDRLHVFVEKIVQSFQGNFEDLEKVLITGESTNNVTVNSGGPTKKPSSSLTSTKRPIKKPTASVKPNTRPQKPAITTLPAAQASVVTKKPTKKPTLATPVVLFQPSSTSQTTVTLPNKKPIKVITSTTVSISTAQTSTEAPIISSEDEDEEQITTTKQGLDDHVDYRRDCGVRPLAKKNGRIVGGKGSTFGEWPWQVLVREATWLGLFTKNKCGGVLITNKYVITAAHCQPGFLANLVAVFGEYDISGEVESKRSVTKNVRRVIVHRQYDAATFENDIALLELESPIQFDSHIVPICMPADDDDFTGRMATVTGWGRLKYGGGVPSVLQEVQVPVIENRVCQEMFHTAGHPKVILSSFLCAGYANGQRDSCEGDSGGPLMVERADGHWILAATVSHGIKCAAPYLPGVYMRTTYYKPWLQTITGVQ